GDFTINRNQDGDVILTVTNYQPAGPGPYFYLSNQNNSVANGLELGKAETGGNITINVSEIDNSVDLTTYNFLLVWCKPFNVRLGFGEFNN
ncbi:MAG: DM13 domain-containing protein, partial [Ekhidna sp.]|nr:DM13 domain-containing protein [Ekhidna sp.]